MSQWMESTVDFVGGMAFRARSGSSYDLLLDASTEAGGTATDMRPIELVLLGLGSCTSMDVISILRKMRQDMPRVRVVRRRK